MNIWGGDETTDFCKPYPVCLGATLSHSTVFGDRLPPTRRPVQFLAQILRALALGNQLVVAANHKLLLKVEKIDLINLFLHFYH